MTKCLYLTALLGGTLLVACNPTSDVPPPLTPATSYFAGYDFAPKPVASASLRVMTSLCTPDEPADLTLNVYAFGPEHNVDEVTAEVITPTTHEANGEIVPDRPDVTNVIEVKRMYTSPTGAMVSDYDPRKQFVVDVGRNLINVVTIEDDAGQVLYYELIDSRNAQAAPQTLCLRKR